VVTAIFVGASRRIRHAISPGMGGGEDFAIPDCRESYSLF
jgi:hypothetical protein